MFMKGYGGDLNKAYLKANMLTGEVVSNIRTVAAFCCENKVLDLYSRELVGPSKQSFKRGQAAGLFYGVSQFFIFSSYGLCIVDDIGEELTKVVNDIGEELMKVDRTIELRGVSFSYHSRPDILIFKDFDLKIRAGKTMALVGQSGSGKSSVVSLILRFYDPTSGKLLKQLSLQMHIHS